MGVIEDVRKVIQDLVAPELKSLVAKLESLEREMKLRDEMTQLKMDALNAKLDTRIDALSAKMDAQYASIMNALDLNRRVESLERHKQTASA